MKLGVEQGEIVGRGTPRPDPRPAAADAGRLPDATARSPVASGPVRVAPGGVPRPLGKNSQKGRKLPRRPSAFSPPRTSYSRFCAVLSSRRASHSLPLATFSPFRAVFPPRRASYSLFRVVLPPRRTSYPLPLATFSPRLSPFSSFRTVFPPRRASNSLFRVVFPLPHAPFSPHRARPAVVPPDCSFCRKKVCEGFRLKLHITKRRVQLRGWHGICNRKSS